MNIMIDVHCLLSRAIPGYGRDISWEQIQMSVYNKKRIYITMSTRHDINKHYISHTIR